MPKLKVADSAFLVSLSDAVTIAGVLDGKGRVTSLVYGVGGSRAQERQQAETGYAVLLSTVDSKLTPAERGQILKAFGAENAEVAGLDGQIIIRGIRYGAATVAGAGFLFYAEAAD